MTLPQNHQVRNIPLFGNPNEICVRVMISPLKAYLTQVLRLQL